MGTLIFDCETTGLLDQPGMHLWCIQIADAAGGEVSVYADRPGYAPLAVGADRLRSADRVVAHNGQKFDREAINREFPGTIDPAKLVDTLVMARLLNPEERSNSLREWGIRLGCHKGDYTGDFSAFTPDLIEYAIQDVIVGRKLYQHLSAKLAEWGDVSCIATEQRFAYLMARQERTGFRLDVTKAQELEAEFRQELADIGKSLEGIFPPRYVPVRAHGAVVVVTPKSNNKRFGYTAGAPFSKVALEVFSPSSRVQVGDRLQGLGWKPRTFTPDGRPKVSEDILLSLPYPEAKRLATYYAVEKKLGMISDGDAGWLRLVHPDGRVRGSMNTIGCAPGRASHSRPNMAQVNKKDLRMREVWLAREGFKLVGCDADGLQARALAHYLSRYDNGAYIDKIVNGNKKDRTDEHSSNLKELPGLQAAYTSTDAHTFSVARDGAKRALYCVLFGGGDAKLGWTIKDGCRNADLEPPTGTDTAVGKVARKALFRAIKGFENLSADIKSAAQKRGFLKGIDGRRVPIRSPHSALVFLMQAAEAAVMKRALVIFEAQNRKGFGTVWNLVANVHDEVQMEVDAPFAKELGQRFAEAITKSGEELGIRCPLVGSFSVGETWADTH